MHRGRRLWDGRSVRGGDRRHPTRPRDGPPRARLRGAPGDRWTRPSGRQAPQRGRNRSNDPPASNRSSTSRRSPRRSASKRTNHWRSVEGRRTGGRVGQLRRYGIPATTRGDDGRSGRFPVVGGRTGRVSWTIPDYRPDGTSPDRRRLARRCRPVPPPRGSAATGRPRAPDRRRHPRSGG